MTPRERAEEEFQFILWEWEEMKARSWWRRLLRSLRRSE